MHLARRLPAGSLREATFAGLQDTAPRAGLLSLHARMDGVGPDSWQDESLVQVWGPREAVWLIHRDAVAAFTLGRLPRDPDRQQRLHETAIQALRGSDDVRCRAGAATGRFLIRWDTRTTRLIPIEPPQVDVEQARHELAVRFLSWFGEEMRPQFAKWAGVSTPDAEGTLRQVPVIRLPRQPRPTGVRFLPLFDPYQYRRRPKAPHHAVVGALLVGGKDAGSWTRQGTRLQIALDNPSHTDLVAEEASRLQNPLGAPVKFDLRG